MALDVHLHGAKVASLRRDGEGYVLAYDEQAVERLGPDRTRISLALPPRAPARRDRISRKAGVYGFRLGLSIYGLSLLVQLLSKS